MIELRPCHVVDFEQNKPDIYSRRWDRRRVTAAPAYTQGTRLERLGALAKAVAAVGALQFQQPPRNLLRSLPGICSGTPLWHTLRTYSGRGQAFCCWGPAKL